MYAKLIKTTSTYFPEEVSTPTLLTIAIFLSGEVGNDVKNMRNFVEDKKRLARGGDAISVDKEDNNIILDMEWHDCDDKCPNKIIISKENFLNILDQWKEVYSNKPDEIIIEQDENDKISITGKSID